MTATDDLHNAITALLGFVDAGDLTPRIAQLEHDVTDCTSADLPEILGTVHATAEVLRGAFLVRERLGRYNDVIHALGIALALPRLLEPGERLKRPSLAAGNDPTRRFDVETDLRIAEFKFAHWRGADTARQRQRAKDYFRLATEETERQRELYVIGPRPLHYLSTTTVTVAKALSTFPSPTAELNALNAKPDMTVSDFFSQHAAHVQVIDLKVRLPDLFDVA